MIINIGSKNPAKVEGVKQGFAHYFKDFDVKLVEVDSGVTTHPSSTGEVMNGAMKRAKDAFDGKCDFSVGMEGGMIKFPGTKSGYFETSVAVVYDGKDFFVGGAPLFEWPASWVPRIINGEEAADLLGEAEGTKEKIYDEAGGVGRLTKNAMSRTEYIKHSVVMALTRIVRKDIYKE